MQPSDLQPEKIVPKAAPQTNKPSFRKLTNEISGPSIKAAFAGNDPAEKKISIQEQFELYNGPVIRKSFDEKELYAKWAKLLETMNDRPNLKSTLNREPRLREDFTILLKIDNMVQEELIKNNKPQLVAWLRKELNNSAIELITELETQSPKKIIYTDEEKLDEMTRKNKNLALLKEEFRLDFDR